MRTQRIGLLSTRLHYFETVVRTGTIRQAAIKLNVALSAISRSISQLEHDLGAALFERIRQRLKLTSAGELLIHHALHHPRRDEHGARSASTTSRGCAAARSA